MVRDNFSKVYIFGQKFTFFGDFGENFGKFKSLHFDKKGLKSLHFEVKSLHFFQKFTLEFFASVLGESGFLLSKILFFFQLIVKRKNNII